MTPTFSRDGTVATLDIKIIPGTLQTTYYGNAKPTDRNAQNGTLGHHEDEHKQDQRDYFTTEHLTEVVERENIALQLNFAPGTTKTDAMVQINQQREAIQNYLRDDAKASSDMLRDGYSDITPVFGGETR